MSAAAVARADSQAAWEALEKHIEAHKCIDVPLPTSDPGNATDILGKAALAALDLIVVADDDRQFVEVNEAVADAYSACPDAKLSAGGSTIFSRL